MVFSDSTFLFCFFPIVLVIYYVLHIMTRNYSVKNIFLFLVSIFFYAWGNFTFLPVILLSIFVNYLSGRIVAEIKQETFKKGILLLAIILNIGILFHYKYQYFILSNLQNLFHTTWTLQQIILPIGISFFTFQGMSYVIDVYWKRVPAQKSLVALGLYISFFPQLIAGPIVRYGSIANQIVNRKESVELFAKGMKRFVIGLGKKVLIANNMAVAADYVFNGRADSTAVLTYWLGGLAYMLQIYFDFSGYSDMAIGLGKIFGFEFEENFNYPYISSNITDFWRRWHISLSSWFRDYVYIPMGGNRCSKARHIRNLFIVWLLTGIWHGANWTFIAWGLLYFVLLVMEKYVIRPWDWKNHVARYGYKLFTFAIVLLAWVIFRCDSMQRAGIYFTNMFGITANSIADVSTTVILREFGLMIGIAIIGSFPLAEWLRNKCGKRKAYEIMTTAWYVSVLSLSIIYIINGTYSPFIYFNF